MKLYAILDLGYVAAENAETVTRALLAGGADLLQLRAKGHPPGEIEALARRILPLCRAAGTPFILNDFPEIAGRVGTDGVHIGQDDGTLADARGSAERGMRIAECGAGQNHAARRSFRHPTSDIRLPASFRFGRSTHSPEQARAALAEGFDYIGFGPLFPTPTKQGRPGIGLADVATVQAEVGVHIPVFCIGGIKRANLPEVLAAGARKVVIVSDLLTADDIESATAEARRAITDCGLQSAD